MGNGQKDAIHRVELATTLGYDAVIATVRADNEKEIHILRKQRWHKVWEFYSRESEQYIQIWTKALHDPRAEYDDPKNYL